jgi:hypothetical protein
MEDPGHAPLRSDAVVTQAVVADGVVTASVPCRRCAYNLRSLQISARCPECGAPVAVSVQGDLLRFSDPQWLQTLSSGANLLLWGIFVNIAVSVVGGFVARGLGPWIAPLIGVAGSVVQLYGAWLLTEPDPSGLGEDRYGRARQTIRVALIVGVLSQFLQFVINTSAPSREVMVALAVTSTAAALVGVVGQFAMLRYLDRLARRIPDDALARRARVVFWGYGTTMLVIVLLAGAAALSVPLLNRTTPAPAGLGAGVLGAAAVGGCVAVIAAGVFGVLFLFLLKRLSTAFADQATLARGLWADPVPAGPAPG